MTSETTARVRESWARIRPDRKRICTLFYQRLIDQHPEMRPLFKGDMARQRDLLVTMLDTVVSALDNPVPVRHLIETLGERHAGYGVTEAHYVEFRGVLLWAIEQGLGEEFDAPTAKAWGEVYDELARTMQAGAARVGG
jgi:hemoglobin-like flavoprotein